MKVKNRSILLFIDNCSSHPEVTRSNIKLVFLPRNTTSKLQPCDAGIIQNLKMHYRKSLVRHVLFHMNDASSASELAKKVNVLNAISWLKVAWDHVQPSTIQKCFSKCGFSDELMTNDENVEVDEELEDFARQHGGVTWEEFSNFDSNLATTMTVEDNWEENLLASCCTEDDRLSDSDEDDEDEENTSIPVIQPRVAVRYLQQLKDFALFHKNGELLELISTSEVTVEQKFSGKNTIQTKLTEFAHTSATS